MTKSELEKEIIELDTQIEEGQSYFKDLREKNSKQEKEVLSEIYEVMQEKLLLWKKD